MKTALVISNDRDFCGAVVPWLKAHHWEVVEAADDSTALELSSNHPPNVILCDLVMPSRSGFKFCHEFRGRHPGPDSSFIIAAGHNGDRFIALESGADQYLAKPLDMEAFGALMAERSGTPKIPVDATSTSPSSTRLKFWGVRGSIPTPGAGTAYYGGNTSCVEVRTGGEIIILDAGSGIRLLGIALAKEFKAQPIHINVLITHTHWDHIQGFPFFIPAYNPKNQVNIIGFEGARQGLQSTLSSQMESPYFPISMAQMPGHVSIQEVKGFNFKVGSIPVSAQFLNHPGACTGYRLATRGGSISYLPDVELFQRLRASAEFDTATLPAEDRQFAHEQDAKVVEFIKESDVLILDSQYNASEYPQHTGWGHSCAEDAVAFALKAKVKRLFLFHHDPDHNDEEISRMVARARQIIARRGSPLIVEAAREGLELVLDPFSK